MTEVGVVVASDPDDVGDASGAHDSVDELRVIDPLLDGAKRRDDSWLIERIGDGDLVRR